MEKLFIYCCINSGGQLEKKSLAKELEVSQQTVTNYIDYLESAGLIYLLPSLKQSGKKALKPRYKLYVADTSIRNAVLMKGQSVLTDDNEMGLIIETTVYKHFLSFHYKQQPGFGFWQNKKKKEVDLILTFPNDLITPIEVKYRSSIKNADLKPLKEFLKISGAKTGLIVVKRAEDFKVLDVGDAQILQVPAFLLLYLLGHSEYQQTLTKN